ncbi:hypothetical protein DQ04_05541040 [Trypanosoma grayi]|uniref:hypothetical protein n=1 Tax=Trypanosoma grayi TaxID=71804 RepID=UPI0004F43794|nr:hypothetical protein DQ04_05541040 [Trypanosoma grayi]KEG09249.1 hypothetical protein DQ04_05541040 [Trypanosoma grayi]
MEYITLQESWVNRPSNALPQAHREEATDPITADDVRASFPFSMDSPMQGRDGQQQQQKQQQQQRLPLQVRLMLQLADGSTRELEGIPRMGQLVHVLCDVLGPDSRNGRGNCSLSIPPHTVVVDMESNPSAGTDLRTASAHRISFFWIDITGMPQLHDMDVLFQLLHVNFRTQREWKAEAATGSDSLDSEELLTSTDESFVEDDSDVWLVRREAHGPQDLDQLHIFVEEQYVQLQLSAIPATSTRVGLPQQNPSSTSGAEGEAAQQPDRLHASIFDVSDEGDLSCVRLLCFRDGIVTWRPRPEVEGWSYIASGVQRRLASTSSTQRMITTSLLLHTILEEICEAFLPDPTVVLNEVDAIDSMLPLVPNRESDQADVLRRVLLLRRSLSTHRRLLMSKVNLLEQLGRPVMRTLLAFITTGLDNDSGVLHGANVSKFGPHGQLSAQRSLSCVGSGAVTAATNSNGYTHTSIANRILHLLRQLDGARTILSNATIIHTSGVAMRNNSSSNESDYRMVVLTYVLLIVLPLTILASHWGMNCWVPWQGVDSTVPFWGLSGVMAAYAALAIAYPLYCWATGRPDKLVF